MELRLNEDGVRWGEVAARGEFGNILANPVEQFVDFEKPLKIRYAKLTATHAVKGEAAFNSSHKRTVVFYGNSSHRNHRRGRYGIMRS